MDSKQFEIADLKNKYLQAWREHHGWNDLSETDTREEETADYWVGDFLDFIEDKWNEEHKELNNQS